MLEKTYLHLLILCCISYHGIIAKLPGEDTRKSSNLLVREKRVISHLANIVNQVSIENANYMVRIKQFNRINCMGVILSHHTVITAATCVPHDVSRYQIFSGSVSERQRKTHNVQSKATHYGTPPLQLHDGIALITADPPFVFGPKTGNIQLYTRPLSERTRVTVTGWGVLYPLQPGPSAMYVQTRKPLQSINIPIMNHEECHNLYLTQYVISEKHICTYDAQQYCCNDEVGSPLIVNNSLAGIYVWKGERQGQRNPDVFINLQRNEYSAWIRQNIRL